MSPESPAVLDAGTWVPRGLVRIWRPTPAFDPRVRNLIACPVCLALLSEPCPHDERLIGRRCPCGELPDGWHTYCSTECEIAVEHEAALSRQKEAA